MLPKNVKIPAIVAFGDSVADQGNNNNLNTIAKCNFRPYGNDFIGEKPTGRFTNGKTIVDLTGRGDNPPEAHKGTVDEAPVHLLTSINAEHRSPPPLPLSFKRLRHQDPSNCP
ncbi:hypothetical protein U1Q18_006007 [Sarracenia purpurea var. burkii]